MIKLIALDIDGTLVLPDLTITPRVQAAIKTAIERGIVVTLATGRGAVPTDQFAASLGLTAPLVCMQKITASGGTISPTRAHSRG